MNTLALIQKKIQDARRLSDAQLTITKYRGIKCDINSIGNESHGSFCYRGRIYTK